MGTQLTQKQFGKILADAAAKVFASNGRNFPDFNTMGREMAQIVQERAKQIESNPEAYEKYFDLEDAHARKYGGVNMHKESALR